MPPCSAAAGEMRERQRVDVHVWECLQCLGRGPQLYTNGIIQYITSHKVQVGVCGVYTDRTCMVPWYDSFVRSQEIRLQ